LAAPADYLRRHTWQPSDDAQPCGQPDAPVHAFNLASVGAARRLP